MSYLKSRFTKHSVAAALLLWLALAIPPHAHRNPDGHPEIRKVEPPNWWLGLPQTLVLLSGENLAGATVMVSYPGVRITRTESRPEGRYILLELGIASEARPGVVPIHGKGDDGNDHSKSPAARTPANRGQVSGLVAR